MIDHNYLNYSLSDVCLGVEKKISKEIQVMHSHKTRPYPSTSTSSLGYFNSQFWLTFPWS